MPSVIINFFRICQRNRMIGRLSGCTINLVADLGIATVVISAPVLVEGDGGFIRLFLAVRNLNRTLGDAVIVIVCNSIASFLRSPIIIVNACLCYEIGITTILVTEREVINICLSIVIGIQSDSVVFEGVDGVLDGCCAFPF